MGVVVTLVVVVSSMLALVFNLTAVPVINPREAYSVVVAVLLAAIVVITNGALLCLYGQSL